MTRSTRRLALYILLVALFLIFLLSRRLATSLPTWKDLPLQAIGLGEEVSKGAGKDADQIHHATQADAKGAVEPVADAGSDSNKKYGHSNIEFTPGKVRPVGEPYSKTLVAPRLTIEDTGWMEASFPNGSGVDFKVYVVNDALAEYHPPENKGHEVMVYLSYIIDHYDEGLADVNIFMHSHRRAWHNNELMDLDAVQMIKKLSPERVQREGYMNLRCSWEPGCPSWLHPGTVEKNVNKQEEIVLAMSWSELFPMDPIPQVLSQPCCAQFAVSRDRIRTLPKARYIFYRDWLLRTKLSDYISGRVWEYIWQFVFTGASVMCPEEHICYCDGYGICFGGKKEYDHFWERLHDRNHYASELVKWREKTKDIHKATDDHGKIDESVVLDIPEFGKDIEYEARVDELDTWLTAEKAKAIERGSVARQRAQEVGRNWTEGDGF